MPCSFGCNEQTNYRLQTPFRQPGNKNDKPPSADPEGGTGGPDPPPGKSQVIWVSIVNKQLELHLAKVFEYMYTADVISRQHFQVIIISVG